MLEGINYNFKQTKFLVHYIKRKKLYYDILINQIDKIIYREFHFT
jgi:hypothetical protein